jgi:hypothetical protein
MGAINSLMKRWGFVRLDQFGLTLTAEGRVLANRPVLDDGFGGRIVGWRDDDLVAMQLEKWPAAQQSARPAAIFQAPIPPPIQAPVHAPIQSAPALQPATIVAEAPVVEEDDWEWTIAMARARAAADEVEEAVVELSSPKPKPRAPTTKPMATVATPKLENTVPYAENPFMAQSWDESRTPRSVVKTVVRQPEGFHHEPTRQVNQRAQSPHTIIPVPKMPRATEQQARLAPVVRAPQVALSPRRSAKGTGQQVSEDTVRTSAVPANDDSTRPSIVLPQQSLPSITKRVAAPQK